MPGTLRAVLRKDIALYDFIVFHVFGGGPPYTALLTCARLRHKLRYQV